MIRSKLAEANRPSFEMIFQMLDVVDFPILAGSFYLLLQVMVCAEYLTPFTCDHHVPLEDRLTSAGPSGVGDAGEVMSLSGDSLTHSLVAHGLRSSFCHIPGSRIF